jgi:hypothetical protein
MERDAELEVLLELNGDVIVFENGMWARFVAARVDPDVRRPHGISYSLTLHSADGKRIFGIDNAHPVRTTRGPSGRRFQALDHIHRGSNTQPYRFVDAGTLLRDFWRIVGEHTGE